MTLLKRFGCSVIAVLSTTLLFTLSARSGVLEVPAHYSTIQAAIDAAANDDTVLVAPGTYYENIDYRDKQITVGSHFLTTGDTSFVSRTVLNGNQNGSVVTIYFNHQEGAMAVLSGVTVTNGKASRGGGLYILDSNARLDHLIVLNNTADVSPLSFQGGGILFESVNYQSKLILTRSAISGNTASQNGGGICLSEWTDVEFHDVLISNNTAGESGGGLSLFGQGVIGSTTVTFDHVEIKDNHASEGGGVYCLGAGAQTELRGLIVHGNGASSAGGGLFLAFSNLENATVFGNSAPKGSGVHCSRTTIIKNSILWNSGVSEISFGAYGVQDTLSISYMDVRGGNNAVFTDNVGILQWLQGNFNLDPRFIDPANGDFHLAHDSPCIDAGDPASDYSNEPHYNGKRIDVGDYGNTAEATPSSPRIDITRQGIDFAKVYFGQTKSEPFTIRNLGRSRLNLELGQLNEGFTILSDTALSILGEDSSIVGVQFAPVRTGRDSSILVISSNDELVPANEITLKGFGVLGGQVTGVLRAKYSPFLVSENLMVSSGQSLTIEPGVTVLSDSGISIIVRGELIADGSETDSITFTSALPKPYPGCWKGLRFEYGGRIPGRRIQYCRFLHADEAVRLYIDYPLDVRHSYFAKCRSWGIYQDGASPGTFEHNTFADLNGGIWVSMSPALIRQNHFEDAKKGVFIFGPATISDNTFKNVQCGVHVFQSSLSIVSNNKFSGTNPSTNGTLSGIQLRYLENRPLEALNAKYGVVVTGGELADAYLINLGEFGDPNRDCVLVSTATFEETVPIPKDGYTRSVQLDGYRTIVLRAKDGGHAKLMVHLTGTIGGTHYGVRGFRYVYVPAGVDSFPRISFQDYSDGIVVEYGNLKVSGNEITNFAGRGIAFQNANVDSFVNNRIFGNGDTGVLFHGPDFFRDEEVVFKAGNNPSQFNDVFDNGKFDFVNGTQTSLSLPYFYWGTTDSAQIAARILDGNDYSELGVVNFFPFLNAAHDPISEVDEREPAIARDFRLKGIHPNPFRKQVSISFEIGKVVPVTVRVLNLLGQEIKAITRLKFIPGVYELSWDGRDQYGSRVATGVYLFEFSVENQRITRRMLRIN